MSPRNIALVLAALAVSQVPANAQEANNVLDQLVPSATAAAQPPKLSGELAPAAPTSDAILTQLSGTPATRSLGDTPGNRIVLAAGGEGEALAAMRRLRSIEVAVNFQGSSDALTAETGGVLASLGLALTDPKLASSKFVIGVHTNAPGSDELNHELAGLRAKAILERLVTVYGMPRQRLVAVGFGRAFDPTAASGPVDQVRVINIGSAAVVAGSAATVAATVPAAAAPVVLAPATVASAPKVTTAPVILTSAPRPIAVPVPKRRPADIGMDVGVGPASPPPPSPWVDRYGEDDARAPGRPPYGMASVTAIPTTGRTSGRRAGRRPVSFRRSVRRRSARLAGPERARRGDVRQPVPALLRRRTAGRSRPGRGRRCAGRRHLRHPVPALRAALRRTWADGTDRRRDLRHPIPVHGPPASRSRRAWPDGRDSTSGIQYGTGYARPRPGSGGPAAGTATSGIQYPFHSRPRPDHGPEGMAAGGGTSGIQYPSFARPSGPRPGGGMVAGGGTSGIQYPSFARPHPGRPVPAER